MQLSAVSQTSMFVLASLSAVMLAIAEGNAWPAGLSVPLAVVALFFTARWNILRLATVWANVLGLVAFSGALVEFFGEDIESRLLSGAHLLVYLTWIVLFQEKQARQYWWLSALGLLQVAVASVLTNGGWFGVMLTVYMFLTIWTFSVFALDEAQKQFSEVERYAKSRRGGLQLGAMGPPWLRLSAADRTAAPEGTDERSRYASMTRGSIQLDPDERWISGRFAGGVLVTTCLAMAVGFAFFLLIPRVWIHDQSIFSNEPLEGGQTLTGFTDEIRLGDMGEILESTQRVLSVKLYDTGTGEVVNVEQYASALGYDEPVFRGAVLGTYRNGRWSSGFDAGGYQPLPGQPRTAMIRQEVQMEPIGTDILFAIHPLRACRVNHRAGQARIHRATSVVLRAAQILHNEGMTYAAYSPRHEAADRLLYEATDTARRIREAALISYLQLPTSGLDRLIALARQVCDTDWQAARQLVDRANDIRRGPALRQRGSAQWQRGVEEYRDIENELIRLRGRMCEQLTAHLGRSGGYSYTLDASIQDASIDPVEDFLFNRKRGHCEYFASALALMLRAVDIPARLVSGFKGGDTNKFNGQFIVQQRHAHSWVEAYVDERWILLDATPASRADSVRDMAATLSSWNDFTQVLNNFWATRVVGMSFNYQRMNYYAPLRDRLQGLFREIGETISVLVARSRGFLSSPRRWFSWQGFVVAFVLLLSICGSVWLARRIPPLWRHLARRFGRTHRYRQTRIEFYERFQKLLAARGLVREASLTQREFAVKAQRNLRELLLRSGLSDLPFDVAEAFYRVRFGAERLPADEAQQIGRLLTQLEDSLRSPNG